MKRCPHCGADLRENARFCSACMTALTEKRVIPTPKYVPVRWLSAAAAVLVLCAAVWAVWPSDPQKRTTPTATPMGTSASSQTTASAQSRTSMATTTASASVWQPVSSLTTLSSRFSQNSTGTSVTTTSTPQQSAVTGSTPTASTSTSFATSLSTVWTTSATASTTSITKKPTTTTTPTQPAVKKYPAEWDTVYRSTTEDGLPIEEVTWSYETIKQYWHLSSMNLGTSYTVYKTYRYEIPLSECIVITGFDAPTSNGIYRIPAAIDGKVVVALDMTRQVSGWCHFNDADIAPTVQRLYLPPELFVVDWNTINRCTSLRAIHVTSHTLWLEPRAVPASTKGLCFYSEFSCNMSYAAGGSPLLASYCDVLNYKDGFYGRRGSNQYHGADWEVSSFASKELYGGGGT